MSGREIKFRVWSTIKSDGEMLYLKSGMLSDLDELPTWKVMQYTGLKDKNGKEIYEGDIVKIHCPRNIVNDYIAVIKWSEQELSWAFDGDKGYWKRPTESIWAWIIGKEIEISGNIYENPELL